jgi:DNA polymerase-3 subunit alpha
MTAEMNYQTGLVSLIEEANKFNIKVLSPDINTSDTNFIAKNGSIYFGMAGIKGVGVAAVDNIVAAREEQPFTSIFDFAIRVEQCNKRILEALIGAGAFDSIYTEKMRSQLFASVDKILDYAKNINAKNNNDIDDLFGTDTNVSSIKEPDLIFATE